MGRILGVLVLAAVFLAVGIWYLQIPAISEPVIGPYPTDVAAEDQLGDFLYKPAVYPEIAVPKDRREGRAIDPIIIAGFLSPIEQQEVPSQVAGQILFIGEEIPEGAVQAAGVAAFMAEPCYYATIWPGDHSVPKFYRRFYEGQVVAQDQMVATVDYTKALGAVLEKRAKVTAAQADERAAKAAADEGENRLRRAERLHREGAMSLEDLGAAQLTKIKLAEEYVSKSQAVNVAREDLNQAEILQRQHEIRSKLPYRRAVIKAILRQRGYAVKELDPIMQIQSLDRLLAEAQIESPYARRLRPEMTATIEPTREDAPARRLEGHRSHITCVAVTKDREKPLIVSGAEDGQVCVWSRFSIGPMHILRHASPVHSIACTPGGSRNLCVTGCADGSIYLWDLDSDLQKPMRIYGRGKAHDDMVTSLAFSPEGDYFASGAADGSMKLWRPDIEEPVYPFDPQHGVESAHQGAVTSLTFTPQCRLVSASRDNTLRVWKLKEKGAAAQGESIRGRDGKVTQLGVSSDGRFMLFDQGRTLQLLTTEEGRPVNTLQAPGSTTPFETLALFSPDSTMTLTAGSPEGRLQLWRTPTETERGFSVAEFVTQERWPVTCAAFGPAAGDGSLNSFAVSASKQYLYVWPVPSKADVAGHRIFNVPLRLLSANEDTSTRQSRIGFELSNHEGRLAPGRPVTIVIE